MRKSPTFKNLQLCTVVLRFPPQPRRLSFVHDKPKDHQQVCNRSPTSSFRKKVFPQVYCFSKIAWGLAERLPCSDPLGSQPSLMRDLLECRAPSLSHNLALHC